MRTRDRSRQHPRLTPEFPLQCTAQQNCDCGNRRNADSQSYRQVADANHRETCRDDCNRCEPQGNAKGSEAQREEKGGSVFPRERRVNHEPSDDQGRQRKKAARPFEAEFVKYRQRENELEYYNRVRDNCRQPRLSIANTLAPSSSLIRLVVSLPCVCGVIAKNEASGTM